MKDNLTKGDKMSDESACAKTCEPHLGGGYKHSVTCMWEHFMSYTGCWKYPEDVREALKLAYQHGYEAGVTTGHLPSLQSN